MAVYKLVENMNLILTIPIEKCSEDLKRPQLKADLIDTMEHYNGVGLSANQCGVMERAFVMYSDINKKEIIACFNPKIVEESPENILMDEGCLTYPGIWLKILRPDHIACSFEDENGELNEVEMFGLEARIFQHEYDHMIGTNFTKRVSKLKLDMAKKRAIKRLKKASRLAS